MNENYTPLNHLEISRPKEQESNQIGIIVVGGMADLPDPVLGLINKSLHADSFKSGWFNAKESLDDKLMRLDQQISQLNEQGKQVILIGVSAGAWRMC